MKIKRCVEKTNEIIEKITDFIMKYRYLIAVIVLILLVALKINFSSVVSDKLKDFHKEWQ